MNFVLQVRVPSAVYAASSVIFQADRDGGWGSQCSSAAHHHRHRHHLHCRWASSPCRHDLGGDFCLGSFQSAVTCEYMLKWQSERVVSLGINCCAEETNSLRLCLLLRVKIPEKQGHWNTFWKGLVLFISSSFLFFLLMFSLSLSCYCLFFLCPPPHPTLFNQI